MPMGAIPAVAEKILVILPGSPESSSLIELLRHVAIVQTAPDRESAAALLQAEHFDLVLGAAGEVFEPRPVVATLGLGLVLDAIDQGVCILDQQGRVVWSNASHNTLPESVRTLRGLTNFFR